MGGLRGLRGLKGLRWTWDGERRGIGCRIWGSGLSRFYSLFRFRIEDLVEEAAEIRRNVLGAHRHTAHHLVWGLGSRV